MSRSDLCTLDEITEMVHSFYARIRSDEVLGPIFNRHIQDWDKHLAIMVSFWSSMMLGAGTYDGTPMPKHVALPGLHADLFKRWLSLFEETTAGLENQEMATRANEYAKRIARSLWFGYQMSHSPNAALQDLDR